MQRRSPALGNGRIAIFTALLAAALFVALFPAGSTGVDIDEGRLAAETIRAPKDVTYTSEVLTQRRRDQAAATVAPILVFDAGMRTRQLGRVDAILAEISRIRTATTLDATQKSAALTNIDGVELTPRAAVLALALTDIEWEAVSVQARLYLGDALDATIGPEQSTEARAALQARAAGELGEGVGVLVVEIAGALIEPNQIVDEEATQAARERAREAIQTVTVATEQGEVVLRAGEIADAAAIEKLRQLGLLRDDLAADDIAGVALLAIVAAAALGLYLAAMRPLAAGGARRLTLLAIVIAVVVAAGRVATPAFLPDDDRLYLIHMAPFAAAAMLAVTLVDLPVALAVAALVALLTAFSATFYSGAPSAAAFRPMDAVALAGALFAGGALGATATMGAERFRSYLVAGAAAAAGSFIMLLAFWLLDPARETADLPWIALAATVGGLASGLVTLGALALFGTVLGLTTTLRLMELAQLDQPLLRRLRETAPGTFHHSILVSSLAERAADATGANALLVRVGSYYHDIGKTLQPSFYIENQGTGANPHEGLDPEESARVIMQHVRGGVELARRHRLPEEVRAFIPEHHGTRLVTFFFRRAAERSGDVDAEAFRYPGPRPQSRETAIVMLADSSEATVRSSVDRSPERIDAIVEGVIGERQAEGELDEASLTLRDLAAIAHAFKSTLRAVYHPRVPYPEPSTAEQRAAAAARGLGAPAMPVDGASLPGAER